MTTRQAAVSSLLGLLFLACPAADGTDDDPTGEGDDCTSVAQTIVQDVAGIGIALAVGTEHTAYVLRADANSPSEIYVVPTAGGTPSLVHRSADKAVVVSLAWADNDLLFLESAPQATASALFKLVDASAPTMPVGVETWKTTERLIGADASSAFVVASSNSGAFIDRVNLATGAVESVGRLPGSGTVIHPVHAGTEIFAVAGKAGGSGAQTVFRFESAASGVDGAPLEGVGANSTCAFPLGGLGATPTKLACGFNSVATFERADGSSPSVILASAPEDNGHIVVGTRGETIFTIERAGQPGTTRRLRALASDGSDLQDLACDLGPVANGTIDGSFPDQTGYLVGVGAAHVVWLEQMNNAGTNSVVIRRAALVASR